VEPQEVSQPRFVLIVGCLGLTSNIVGLFLFHDHGHSSHSHGGHTHGPPDTISDAEQGHAFADEGAEVVNETANNADTLPQRRSVDWPRSKKEKITTLEASGGSERSQTNARAISKHGRSTSRTFSTLEDMPVNPSSFRRSVIDGGRLQAIESAEGADGCATENEYDDHNEQTPDQLLLGKADANGYGSIQRPKSVDHHTHKHTKPKDISSSGGHGHSHNDLNMHGVFLHVMGDALGNIGVIASALFIWLSDYPWRHYSDPAISLIITMIILASAIPLCQAASRILLQAVPAGLSIDDIKEDIEKLPSIVSCHHVHVWQLSDVKLVASLHVQVDFDFEGEGSAKYMELARAIRDCLHEHGVHSSTIQPEFCLDPEHDHSAPVLDSTHLQGSNGAFPHKALVKQSSNTNGLRATADTCLLDCSDACNDQSCCAPSSINLSNDHDHSHDHNY
jgi:zinc transporter 1